MSAKKTAKAAKPSSEVEVTNKVDAGMIQTLVEASKDIDLAAPVVKNGPVGPKPNCVCASCKHLRAVKQAQVIQQ